MDEESPLIAGSKDLVVQATLHRCAHTLQSTLDCEQILSRLNEEGILPLASAPSTHHLFPPDNPSRQATNILFWLRGVSRAQFERFIAIVRETGKGSRPHEELALKLEEEYGRLINDPDATQSLARDFHKDLRLYNPSSQTPLSRFCCSYPFSWHCKIFFLSVVLYMVLLAIAGPSIYLKLRHGLKQHSASVSPTPVRVSGSSALIEVQLDASLTSLSSVTLTVNCSGQVLVSDSIQCSALNHSTVVLYDTPMQYLLTGSSFRIGFNNHLPHQFLIIKSLSNFQQYCGCSDASDFCFDPSKDRDRLAATDGDECTRNCNLKEICASQHQDGVHCISITDDSYNYLVQSDDWYYQEFGSTCPIYHGIAVVQYNRLQIQSASFKTFILNGSIQSGPQSVNFPVTGDIKCILLDIHCPSNRAVYKVEYTVTSATGPSSSNDWPSFFVIGVVIFIGVVLFLIQAIACFWKRFRQRKESCN